MTMEAESALAGARRSPPPLPPPEAIEEGGTAKPLMVRIKRKRLQPPVESLWLEVSERPIKRLEAELLSFSLNDSDSHNPGKVMEGKPTRLLFHHLDTVTSFGMEETTRVNTLFREFHNETGKERHRSSVKSKDQRGKYLTTAREKYQALANKARFEQVWRSRKGAKKLDTMSELFHLYDIVRVDVDSEAIERHQRKEQAKREAELAESQLLQNFLPLFKEYLPTVAAEVESSSTTLPMNEVCADEYVYDVYYLEGGADGNEADMPDYPMVQVVDDDDFRWGLSSESEYDSEDSNDENNPMNDYPEEEEDSELSLDAENDTSQSGLEVEDEQQSTKSDGSDVLEESEDYWDNSGYDSAEEERYGN